jgi:hypothetical protein
MRTKLAPDLSDVVSYVAERYAVSKKDLLGRSRVPHLSEARAVAYYLARHDGHSFPRIGKFFCRDHTTVMAGVKTARRVIQREPTVAAMVSAFSASIESAACEQPLRMLCINQGENPIVDCAVSAATPVDCMHSNGVDSVRSQEAAE